MSGEDLVGDSGGNLAVMQEARALGGRRAGYDDDRCKLRLCAGFIQERNIHAEPMAVTRRRTRTGGPGFPDRGVEDLFKFTAFRGIREDSLTQPGAIGPAGGVEGTGPERVPHGVANAGIVVQQIPRTPVSVE